MSIAPVGSVKRSHQTSRQSRGSQVCSQCDCQNKNNVTGRGASLQVCTVTVHVTVWTVSSTTISIYLSFCRDIQERYRTLKVYDIVVSEEELQMVQGLEQQWKDLFVQGREVDRSLIKVKKKFTLV